MPAAAHPFLVALALTALLIALTFTLGRLGRRKPHIASAAVTAALLVYAVYQAEMLGRALRFPRGLLVFHLVFANLAALSFLAVIATGVRLARREAGRRGAHRRVVYAFVALTAVATLTGTWMLTRASE
jgi:hypothetical protein